MGRDDGGSMRVAGLRTELPFRLGSSEAGGGRRRRRRKRMVMVTVMMGEDTGMMPEREHGTK